MRSRPEPRHVRCCYCCWADVIQIKCETTGPSTDGIIARKKGTIEIGIFATEVRMNVSAIDSISDTDVEDRTIVML
jgi:hypothetical protein